VRDNAELKVLECSFCGLVFLSSFDHIKDDFYENSKMHGEEMLDIQTWLSKTAVDDERRFQCLKSILSNRKLLDFGCGAGGFLLRAQKLAATVIGVESEDRLKSHFQDHNLDVYSNLSDIPCDIRREGYDIITMFHVLEHISNPKSLLGELIEMLNKNGQIVIEVPNADDALLTLYNNEPFSNFTYWSCHLFLYTAKTLKMLFDQINLKVNYIKQIQRYSIANHLYWLSNGKPRGHKEWNFFDSKELNDAYGTQLAKLGKCDTILASISKS
jgi:2-polyprenyl-3-methyl-5-hydroxy-6-metoxy-1,4-benzoquinol methylase